LIKAIVSTIICTAYLFLLSCATSKKNVKAMPKVEPEFNRIVLLQTSYGNITLRLYDSTKQHKANFIKLVKENFYDSLLFHRVINTFMIQGGDPNSKYAKPSDMLGMGGLNYRVPFEFIDSLYHKRGALAAASDGNPEKASSSTQFYIVQGRIFNDAELDQIERNTGIKYTPAQRTRYKTQGGAAQLDRLYTVFGEVIDGMNVVDSIARTKRGANNRPLTDIRMKMSIIH
jgi:cyclophilin family peptidyl-prolyl cis-trans isomerase